MIGVKYEKPPEVQVTVVRRTTAMTLSQNSDSDFFALLTQQIDVQPADLAATNAAVCPISVGQFGETLSKLVSATSLMMAAMVRQSSIEKVNGIRMSHKKSKIPLVRLSTGRAGIYYQLS